MAKKVNSDGTNGAPSFHVNTPKFYMVRHNEAIIKMFEDYGYRRVFLQEQADLVVFGGGADINPYMYGEYRRQGTMIDMDADRIDNAAIAKMKKGQGFIGICRGAQLLNVRLGFGSLWQDVNGHRQSHIAFEVYNDKQADTKKILVTSTHHQMMIPGPKAEVLLGARKATRFYSEKVNNPAVFYKSVDERTDMDVEAVYYRDVNAFCFQPHPEHRVRTSDSSGNKRDTNTECRDWFFEHIGVYMLSREQQKAVDYNLVNNFSSSEVA